MQVSSTSCKFTNGIQSPSINPSISGGTFNIATTSPPATINIGTDTTTTNINIGNGNVSNNLTGVVMLARNTSGTYPTYMECVSSTTFNYIDFHTNSTYNRDYDVRIITSGSDSLNDGKGTLSITADTLTQSGIAYIGTGTPINIYANLQISTTTATRRDGIVIKATASNGMDFMQFWNQANTQIGSIGNSSGTGVTFNTTSDRRLKKDIVQMENIIDKIMMLKPCKYKWISNNQESFGFIAQEAHAVFPQLRVEIPNNDGDVDEPHDKDTGKPLYYGLDYGRFTPYIVKAIQEIKQDYETKIYSLEERIQTLEKLLLKNL